MPAKTNDIRHHRLLKLNESFQTASPNLDSYNSTVLIGATQVLGGLLGTALMASKTRLGSRCFLVTSSASVCSCCMLLLAAVSYLAVKEAATVGWASLVLLVVFTLSYMTGLGPIPWVLIGELLPGNLIQAH